MKVTIEIIDQSHATLAILDGHLDSTHYERVEREVVAAIESTTHRSLVLDFGDVSFVSSAGLRTLINLIKRTRTRGGTVWLAAVRPPVQQVFELSGLTSLFRSASARGEALRETATAGPGTAPVAGVTK
ncbi:MAG: anti-sigma factor antagonist [Planctomycetes bacterium]|nr:anti-sigma factor antagonist [Planctomycetota bacterium]